MKSRRGWMRSKKVAPVSIADSPQAWATMQQVQRCRAQIALCNRSLHKSKITLKNLKKQALSEFGKND